MIPAATADADTSTAPAAPAAGGDEPVRPPEGDDGRRSLPAVVRRRLSTVDERLNPYSWLAAIVVTVIGGILRIVNVDRPKGYIFDEVYYPTDAWDMLQHAVEWDEKTNGPAYVVHPPLGKWMIALGEQIFGNNELGWRIVGAVCGTLMVLITARIAYRLFRSVVLSGAAGLLLALDGFHLVLSRTSLLDIFLGFYILLTFACLLIDRDQRRTRWRTALETGFDPAKHRRPRFGFLRAVPWWRLLAAFFLGCAVGVKWSAAFFAPFFAILVVVWEVRARRSAGIRRPVARGIVGDIGWLLLSGVVTTVVYLGTWAGWFLTDTGYFRHWLADNGRAEPPVLGALINLFHYHQEAFGFHTQLDDKHTYQSWPWQWLLLGRPVAFYWNGEGNCGAPSCAAEILLLGTPLLWWSFLPALVAAAWFGIARRDWRAPAILVPVVAGMLPWYYYAIADGRTMFSFYLLPAVPFLVLAVVYVLGAIMTPPEGLGPEKSDRQIVGAVVAGLYVLLVAACFAYFYPVFTGQLIPYEDWSSRMWLGPRWI
ncbi:dolichyl-phosphate-mannose--protein mannosyltransferase [Spirilliplanes yamanashiensis]|uniref:dolichyl-phosphate-mannose--protein mannosyltransferase n=1 Tax=Spirilliplanes yamanashiensis TaxID=42233 RepID=UPI003521442F